MDTRKLLLVVKGSFWLTNLSKFILTTSNINAACNLSVGSGEKELHAIGVDIFKFCLRNNVQLIPQCIPREQNQIDELSRISSYYCEGDPCVGSKLFKAVVVPI